MIYDHYVMMALAGLSVTHSQLGRTFLVLAMPLYARVTESEAPLQPGDYRAEDEVHTKPTNHPL